MSVSEKEIPVELFERREQSVAAHDQIPETPSLNFLQDVWRRLRKNKTAVACMFILLAIILLAYLAPVIAPYDPYEQNVAFGNLPIKIPGVHIHGFDGYIKLNGIWFDKYESAGVPEGTCFLFGTDEFGRDLLSRALYGMRISLTIAFLAAFLDLTIGLVYGLVSGMKGGRTDTIMMRIIEIISGVPNLVIVVLMILIFKPGITSILIAMVMSSWISMARIVRAQAMKVKSLEYVSAARVLGASDAKIAFQHILPNISGIVIVRTMFSIPAAIFFETFLSFIGVGLTIPNASIGTLLNSGFKVFRIYPYQMWVPTVIICIIMLSFNLFADGLRDAFDPKMKD